MEHAAVQQAAVHFQIQKMSILSVSMGFSLASPVNAKATGTAGKR